MLVIAEQAAGLLQDIPYLFPVDIIEKGAVVGICYKVLLLIRKSAGARHVGIAFVDLPHNNVQT